MSANRTTIINSPQTREVVTREVYRESDSVAGWLVAGLIALVLVVGGLFIWASRTNSQAQLDATTLSARTQGFTEGAQLGANTAGGAAGHAAANAGQAAVNAALSADQAREASEAAANASTDGDQTATPFNPAP